MHALEDPISHCERYKRVFNAMARILLILALAFIPIRGVSRSKHSVQIHSFKDVVAAVSRAKSFQVTQANGDSAQEMLVECPNKVAVTTISDVAVRTASVSIGNDEWQSSDEITGPWIKRKNTSPQVLCGKSELVFPSELDLKSAARGKVVTNARASCEEWELRSRDNKTTYTYCIQADKLPVWRRSQGELYLLVMFSGWNKPVKIEPPQEGKPPCCPLMR
jgi:hypothetical protein